MKHSGALPSAEITAEEVISIDRKNYPGEELPVRVETVAAGASGRYFFRIHRGSSSKILMAYPQEPEENRFFGRIGTTLHENGIPVPKVIRELPAEGLVWLEDLGDRDLYSLGHNPAPREPHYRNAVEQIKNIQRLPKDVFYRQEVKNLPPFDEDLYLFEQQYFAKELMDRICPADPLPKELLAELQTLRERLLAQPTTWVHRDYQSKNLMIDASDSIRIVDFQGIRQGHPYYDLASLLCDPYVNLPQEERGSYFEYYCSVCSQDSSAERQSFVSAAAQRLMQALGAYGRFGIGGGVSFFREKIPVALALLEENASAADLPLLSETAKRLGTDLQTRHSAS